MAKTAWIIGGGSGIGAAVARRLAAAEGFTVAISGRRPEKLAEIAADNPQIRPLPLDVTDSEATRACLIQLLAEFGRIDLVLYGAVAPVRMPVGQYGLADFRAAFEANYFGFVHLANALIEPMALQGGGQIAVIGSLAGYYGLPTSAAYSSSKAAIIALAQTMHVELASRAIDVRLISPGYVRSELTARNRRPMPFLMEADEAARRIVDGLLRSGRFEIAFPWRMAMALKLLRLLPYPLAFGLLRTALPKKT